MLYATILSGEDLKESQNERMDFAGDFKNIVFYTCLGSVTVGI